jgi:hypothetical protein
LAIKVILSPFYGKYEWFDEVSQTLFSRSSTSYIEVVDISNLGDFNGIRKAVRLNVLQIIEGVLPDESNSNSQASKDSLSSNSRHKDSNDTIQSTRAVPTEVIIEEVTAHAEESEGSNEAEASENGTASEAEADKKETVKSKTRK